MRSQFPFGICAHSKIKRSSTMTVCTNKFKRNCSYDSETVGRDRNGKSLSNKHTQTWARARMRVSL